MLHLWGALQALLSSRRRVYHVHRNAAASNVKLPNLKNRSAITSDAASAGNSTVKIVEIPKDLIRLSMCHLVSCYRWVNSCGYLKYRFADRTTNVLPPA